MLRRILNYFKKPAEIEEEMREIELSKINRHANFLLRKDLGDINKYIQIKIGEINIKKEEVLHELRELHKKKLMNSNIPQREIHIMQGNRDNYIKRVAQFLTSIDVPKNYIENYEYCSRFKDDLLKLYQEIEKNIMVLGHFFDNEVKNIHKKLADLEKMMSELKTTFEKNNIDKFRDMNGGIEEMRKNIQKIEDLQRNVDEEKENIRQNADRISKLNERVQTITSGTDYRALESFKAEKQEAEGEYKKKANEIHKKFMDIDTSLKKYSYRHPDKKLVKQYMDNPVETLVKDHNMEIAGILEDVHKEVQSGEIELKDKKKEQCMHILEGMNIGYLREHQAELNKLHEHKQRIQTKITHNSASLNLSEQEYWIRATDERIAHHQSIINKLQKDIEVFASKNSEIEARIKGDVESVLGEEVTIINDLFQTSTDNKSNSDS